MKLLITGGAGFIGSQLADYFLRKNYQVTVIDNLSWGRKEFISHNLKNRNFKFIKLDLLNYKQLEKALDKKIDTVFHLVANSDIARGAIDPAIDFKNTSVVTFNLLEAMRAKGIKKIFYTSGSGVYGDVGVKKTPETFGPLLPISMYGATKLSAEAMISSFVHLYDMRAWILRPANIIGPRATHGVIFDFINKLRRNSRKLKILGDGTQSKSYLYIDDVLSAMNLVWRKAKAPISLFNLTSTTFITVKEIAEIVFKEMRLEEVKIQGTKENRGWKGDVPIVRMSNFKLHKLGWRAKYNSRQAVEKTTRVLLGQAN